MSPRIFGWAAAMVGSVATAFGVGYESLYTGVNALSWFGAVAMCAIGAARISALTKRCADCEALRCENRDLRAALLSSSEETERRRIP